MAVVPALPPVGTGVGSSSFLSALEAVSAFLLKPPMAELVQIVAQSVPNATYTMLTFTSHLIDQDYLGGAGHSDSVNTSRYTANWAGWYEVAGGDAWAANATGRRISSWFVNGSQASSGQIANPTTAASDGEFAARPKKVYLNVGDFLELGVYQESGGALLTMASPVGLVSSMSVKWASN